MTDTLGLDTVTQTSNAPQVAEASSASITQEQPEVRPTANQLIEKIVEDLGKSSVNEKSLKPSDSQTEDARRFVSLLSFYGIVFQNVISETFYFDRNTDWDNLARIYKDLNLPVPAKPPSQQLNGTMGQAKSRPTRDAQTSSRPAQTDTSQASLATATNAALPDTVQQKQVASSIGDKPSSQTPPITSRPADNRAAYLAKLKAAKMKVAKPTEGGVRSTSASATPPVQLKSSDPQAIAPLPTNAIAESNDLANASTVAEEAEARKKRQNEVLQQRLAALKAKQSNVTPTKTAAATPAPLQTMQHTPLKIQTPPDTSAFVPVGTSSSPLSGIPGLFMSGVPAAQSNFDPTNFVQATAAAPQSVGRKRPVAADFEDFASTPQRPQKSARSYSDDQQEQYEPMVIEVSDDDDDDGVSNSDDGGVGVEDEVTSLIRSAADAVKQPPSSRTANGRAPGTLTDFPPQSLSSNTSSLQGTPGVVGTPGTAQLDLRIAEMKAKIAAREALQRRKLNSSRPQTPQKSSEADSALSATTQTLPQMSSVAIDASTGVQTVPNLNATTQQYSTLSQQLTNPSASSAGRSESPAEHRTRRQADLQSIDARLASNMSKMEQLRAEMARLEAENQHELQEKEALQRELEAFGVDTEGMEKHEMEAVRDGIRQQQATIQEDHFSPQDADVPGMEAETGVSSSAVAADSEAAYMPVSEQGQLQANKTPTTEDVIMQDSQKKFQPAVVNAVQPDTESTQTISATPPAAIPVAQADEDVDSETDDEELYTTNPVETQEQASSLVANDDDFDMSDEGEGDDSPVSEQNANAILTAGERPSESTNEMLQPTEANLSHTTFGEAHTHDEGVNKETSSSPSSGEDNEDDDDDFYEPDPSIGRGTSTPLNDGAPDQARVASASHDVLSASDLSEDASGKEPVAENSVSSSASSEQESAVEDDEYEPAAASLQQVVASPDLTGQISGANEERHEFAETGHTERVESFPGSSVSQSPRSSGGGIDEPHDDPDAELSDSLIGSSAKVSPEPPAPIADDLAPEIQPGLPVSQAPAIDTEPAHYQPYQSPLRMFKDYRYHPQYSSEVQGGYRSMTYSHQIDVNRPVCPYEADGGICNDPDCQGQHFKGMQLNGASPES